ncbi:hypothetical protein [Rubrivirga sp. IMCC45206]|uniref:hypothetical protein n=1 Tax=Rubrivirga sp. IMCC45206 TaxID=3391614 RepID=UPI00398FBDB6
MFPALRPLLNKGGAGRYVSRQESAERLMPVAERHLDLLDTYTAAMADFPDGPSRTRLDAMMPYLRTEVAKISETILSLGAAPPTGAGRGPIAPVTGDARARVDALLDAEKGFSDALAQEVDVVHHQERTRAILNHNAEASAARIDLLRGIAADLPR